MVNQSEKSVELALEQLPDPEIPVLNLYDLGIIHSVEVDGRAVWIELTPTYTACPATEAIEASVRAKLVDLGFETIQIRRLMQPAWTTDAMSPEAAQKLKEFGIDPPVAHSAPTCPRCGSNQVSCLGNFGSTPCKAPYKCNQCLEPFERFKCHR